MSDIFTLMVGTYEEKIEEAVELICSAAGMLKEPYPERQLFIAKLDFDKRINAILYNQTHKKTGKGVTRDD